MGEWFGVLIALVSSCLGGTAAAVTRYLVGNADPITLAILRWGIGFLCVLPAALVLRVRWPQRSDWLAVAALGLCFFGLFFVLYNIAVELHDRGPRQPRAVDAAAADHGGRRAARHRAADRTQIARRRHRGARRRAALASGLSAAPAGAWRGELIMAGAVLCMAFYNVWSRPFIQRSSALGFLTVGMGAGAAALVAGRRADRPRRGAGQLRRPAMDRRHLSRRRRRRARVHPVGAGAAARDADPRRQHHDRQPDRGGPARHATGRRADHANLVIGLVAVFAGIWIATTEGGKPEPAAKRSLRT